MNIYPLPSLEGGKTKSKSSSAKKSGKKGTKKNKFSACVHLNKEQCRFPCRKIRKNADMEKYGHCRSIFSKKRTYMDTKTKRLIRSKLQKLKTAESKAQKKTLKAKTVEKKVDTLKKEASKESAKADSFFDQIQKTFSNIQDSLGVNASSVKSEPKKTDTETQNEPEITKEPETAETTPVGDMGTPSAEETKTEEPKTEETKTEEPKTEEPKTEETKTEEPMKTEDSANPV
jgi:hypothetical protein